MTPINQIVLLQWLMNEAKEKKVAVTNKETGASTQVNQSTLIDNPSKYKVRKPKKGEKDVESQSPDPERPPYADLKTSKKVSKTAKQRQEQAEKRSAVIGPLYETEYGKTEEGKELLGKMYAYIKNGKISPKNGALLRKKIFYNDETDSYEIKDGPHKIQLNKAQSDAIRSQVAASQAQKNPKIVSNIDKAVKQQSKRVKQGTLKKVNLGDAAEDALVETFSSYSSGKNVPHNIAQNLSVVGIDPTKPFEVYGSGKKSVKSIGHDGSVTKIKSKADIIIVQNGVRYNISVKYAGGGKATYGAWRKDQIKDYYKKNFPDMNENEVEEFASILEKQSKPTISYHVPPKSNIEKRKQEADKLATYLKKEPGISFIERMMSSTTATGTLPENEHVSHVMIIGEEGELETYTPRELIKALQEAGAGTAGCGVEISYESGSDSSGEIKSSLRSAEILDIIIFKSVIGKD